MQLDYSIYGYLCQQSDAWLANILKYYEKQEKSDYREEIIQMILQIIADRQKQT